MKKKILLVLGDPNSINSELVFKTLNKLSKTEKKKIIILANLNLLKSQFKRLNYKLSIKEIFNIKQKENSDKIKVLNIGTKLKFKNPFNLKLKERTKYIKNSLDIAHNIASNNKDVGILNCAIDKKIFKEKRIGVTEYLAHCCKIKNNSEVMLITSNKISVCPITTHIDLKNISKNITKKKIVTKTITIQNWFLKKNKKKPKIAILGLNPHNAELRKNSEEMKIIIPAIRQIKKLKINATGPLIADTIFINDYKNYDIIIGMYHDQVLAPMKALFKYKAINITLGLKYLRVSPDHGTAAKLIKKNKANPESLIKCIKFLNKFI